MATKTEVFCNKNRKSDPKNSQKRKTENPNAPLNKRPECSYKTSNENLKTYLSKV